MKRVLSVLAISFIFLGCIPKSGTYYKFHTVYNGEYIHDTCYGKSGKPSSFFFFYNEIYISVNTDTPYGILLGIHIPKNNTVQLLERHISFINDKEKKQKFSLKPIAQYLISTPPYAYDFGRDPYLDNENYFGILKGDSRPLKTLFISQKSAYKWYQFSTDFHIENNGTIVLPKLKINGLEYKNIKLKLNKDEYFQIDGFNC